MSAGLTLMVNVLLAVAPAVSVMPTVNVTVPVALGTPLIAKVSRGGDRRDGGRGQTSRAAVEAGDREARVRHRAADDDDAAVIVAPGGSRAASDSVRMLKRRIDRDGQRLRERVAGHVGDRDREAERARSGRRAADRDGAVDGVGNDVGGGQAGTDAPRSC